ncbi:MULTISPECIES: TerD family protein [unclassified Streptomyces]|uniref:TerD family protein n=1 Tax=Streptomyces sp. NPDC005955 TaxID=3364738 RepID=UPI003684D48D
MSGGLNKGLAKVEVGVRWDPSPSGTAAHDLDVIAATYTENAPYGAPEYLVHFGSRSPDGTITLNRDSRTGQGFGYDEVMVLELDRLAPRYERVIVGVAIQQPGQELTFGDIVNAAVRIRTGALDIAQHDFGTVLGNNATTIAEFTRDGAGAWQYRQVIRGFDADPASFAEQMGRAMPSS